MNKPTAQLRKEIGP
ncbi:hypothetical protein WG8_3954 [Paenibacillus sp. Aloe-11]|nr:hypothetical protein WG8_3954 [Paenibacillus sp. Aloe-11]